MGDYKILIDKDDAATGYKLVFEALNNKHEFHGIDDLKTALDYGNFLKTMLRHEGIVIETMDFLISNNAIEANKQNDVSARRLHNILKPTIAAFESNGKKGQK